MTTAPPPSNVISFPEPDCSTPVEPRGGRDRFRAFLLGRASPLGIGVSPVQPRKPYAVITAPAVSELDLPAMLSLEAPVLHG